MAKPTDTDSKTADPKRSSRLNLSLGQRLFLLSAALVVLAVGASVAVTQLIGASIAGEALRAELERSTALQSNLAEDRLDQLFLRASVVSNDPNFIAYLTVAIQEGDAGSLIDQLDERQRDLEFDFAIALDGDGQTVARTDIRGGGGDLSDSPLFRAAMESGQYSADGIWVKDGGLYYAVMVPLVTAGNVLGGYFIAAYAIDDVAALELRQLTGTEVTFLIEGEAGSAPMAVATTLDPAGVEQLTAQLGARVRGDAAAGEVHEVLIGRDRYLISVKPVTDVAGAVVGRVVNLGSLDQALGPYSRIGQVLLIVGLVVVVLSLAASFILARGLLQPIHQLVEVTGAAAEGHLDVEITGRERPDEVGQLANSVSALLSELREQRDMQVYLTELTRSLPEQDKALDDAVPAQALTVSVLGFELQSYGRRLDTKAPRESLEAMSQDLRRFSRQVMAQGGRIECAIGNRLVAVFTGDRHESRALGAAAQLVTHSGMPVLVSMVCGEVLTGTLNWQNRSMLACAGGPMDELENLMRVALPHSMLLSTSTYRQLTELLSGLGITGRAHRANWSPEPIYTLTQDDLGRLSQPEAGTTMAITSGVTSTIHTGGAGRATLAGISAGSVLGNRFEIISELGAGGMGVVYKALDRELRELVALKMLKHDAFADETGLEKLKEELKLARKISHPNVLRTFDFGEADGFPFISMEFVRGVTLKHLLEQSDRLPLSAGLHMARQLCRGLAAAHEQSVIHRDIKPENMIIEPTGNVKLMDFGIAQTIRRRRGDETSDGPIVGTPFYLAPEQLEGKEPDVRADIYSSGVVFFEIFCGTLPYPTDGSVMKIIGRKLNEEPQRPSEAWPDMPVELERIMTRCLERDRERRYPDVPTLLEDLEVLRA